MRAKVLTIVGLAVAAATLPLASFAGTSVGVSIGIGGPPVAYYPPPVAYYPPPVAYYPPPVAYYPPPVAVFPRPFYVAPPTVVFRAGGFYGAPVYHGPPGHAYGHAGRRWH
jgi:hypothetical protein